MAGTNDNMVHPKTDRPASQRKIDKILDAARVEFFTNGFSASTIEAIAARAEVSKVTIYSWFKDKENLFAQLVQSECAHMRENFVVDNLEDRDLRDILLHAAHGMLDFLTRSEMVRFERILAAEVNRDPRIGEYFLDNGPRILLNELTKLLQASIDKGEIHSDDVAASAEMFPALVMGRTDFFLRYGHEIKMSAAEKDKRAVRAVDSWLLIHKTQ
ncbi:TetR/AcrR family transcriptional regulator [Parasphingorhabdus halotolerans]|uniref:TetR/AcrR family transcriptional regulator n=1 Tax=Parasphingorhabdus halotolerans TaxID=2725558 RepID=A0A6H2DQ29_9SPHN|nr:TetR/AcrR family transcriptional regulator [Parasphingorhabdus halotolerans]QJB70444.1 TetR/AcrR family transcriptional regulator [Parasphingorhabdus halotolerans]